ncbi:MAG: glycosyltransferase [Gammaproteobacteria bacterium]
MGGLLWLALPGAIIWAAIVLSPWQPWRTRERLDATRGGDAVDLSDITILIPARNEADCLATTLTAVAQQGRGLRIVLIDDASDDATVAVAEGAGVANLEIIRSRPLPDGWSGKTWALQQGLEMVGSDKILLLDADIQLLPGTLAAMRHKMQQDDLQLLSLMALLRTRSRWEKLLIPAFVYFFKLLYPFRLANSCHPLIAAAAGGCVLLQRRALQDIGGFAAIRDAIIDDCTLARQIKNAGYRTWIGLTRSAVSLRAYDDPAGIRAMVTRTAFTQLRFSVVLLLLCTLLMLGAFVLPLLSLALAPQVPAGLGGMALLLMLLSYVPIVHYYRLAPLWVLGLPLAGVLYLAMTWDSAWRYRRGISASWKGRDYLR